MAAGKGVGLRWMAGSIVIGRHDLHKLKGLGYLISTLSVLLLAVVSWSNAQKDALLTACLLAGAATSIVGMFCRWLSYELEKRMNEKQAQKPQARPQRAKTRRRAGK